MGGVAYGIKVDDYSAAKALRSLDADMDRIRRKILARIGAKTVSYVQREKLRGQVLNRQSGHLAQGLHFVWAGPYTIFIGPSVKYGAIHEYGGDIYPVNAKALAFPGADGETVFTQHVKIPARPWLEPGMGEYLTSNQAEQLVERTLQAELNAHGGDHNAH